MPAKKKAMLIILDGFGEGKKEATNAVYAAKTPYINSLRKEQGFSLIEPGGASVGVLPGQTGGSDVGHNTIGAGRVVRQPIKIIYDAIQDKSFYENEQFVAAINHAKKNNSNLHLFGIGSDSMIHAHLPYLYALLDICKLQNFPGNRVFLHLCADGRDNLPQSAIDFFAQIEAECEKRKVGKIASVIGRFYLDRGKVWERTEKIYDLLTDEGQKFMKDVLEEVVCFPDKGRERGLSDGDQKPPKSPLSGGLSWRKFLQKQYSQNVTDEFLPAQAFGDENGMFPRVQFNDAMINFCYRADRERQITAALTESEFDGFKRKVNLENFYYLGMIPYAEEFTNAHAAFQEEQANLCMSEIIDSAKLKQFHIAGKEKIIFVTYNLNRCKDLELSTETDECAPQTQEVETFDLNPEMSTPNLTKILCEELEKDEEEVYIVNYENCDQVGHTGNLEAAIQAVESVDLSLSKVIPKALEKGFEVLITADHGNADQMRDELGRPHTAHSANKVPCFVVSGTRKIELRDGELSDIAPTFLEMLGLEVPEEMTGKSLIK